MKIRHLAAVAAFAIAIFPLTTRAAGSPYEITVVLALTGPVTFVGEPQRSALEALENYVNSTGGINGESVKFIFKDDTSSPATSVQLASQVVSQQGQVMLGPTFVGACSAVSPLMAHGPVDFCLSPALHPAAGSFAFSSSVSTIDLMDASVRFFRERGIHRVATITSNDATGQDADKALADIFERPENRSIEVVDRQHFAPADLSVAAQIAHIKAANPQLLLTWVTGTPVATVLRGAHEAGLDIPVYSTTSNATYVQMREYASFLPKTLYFPGPIGMTEGGAADRETDNAINVFDKQMVRIGEKVLYAHTTAWDPGLIFISALRKLGTHASAEQIRDYISNLQDFTGVNGRYDFKKYPQRGLGIEAAYVVRWDADKKIFVRVSKAGGAAL